jgi:hypothetical protein
MDGNMMGGGGGGDWMSQIFGMLGQMFMGGFSKGG